MTDEPITFVGTEAANARIAQLHARYGVDRYMEMDRRIKVLSDWLDSANAHRDPEARTWGRLAKLAEESGEVVEAYIGFTGQNPRKGNTHLLGDVLKELMDVALTALQAYHHLTQGNVSTMAELEAHMLYQLQRVGLE